eukprot:1159119-Pelagomonas_calceolata.AAC.3
MKLKDEVKTMSSKGGLPRGACKPYKQVSQASQKHLTSYPGSFVDGLRESLVDGLDGSLEAIRLVKAQAAHSPVFPTKQGSFTNLMPMHHSSATTQ